MKNKNTFFQESSARALAKTFIYRFVATIGVAVLTWLFTGDFKKMIAITIAIQIFLMILYYFNERIWNEISWGKQIEKEK